MPQEYLIPECHFEQEILLLLGFSLKREISKAKGCAAVITRIEKQYTGKLAIGWIDHDPAKQFNRPKSYYNYAQVDSKYGMLIKKSRNNNHYLIEIHPEFEPWIESLGKSKGVRKEDFNIPFGLHEYSKAIISNNVRKYFHSVIENNNEAFEFLKEAIKKMIENKY